jgi:HSP20 family protein
MISLQSSRLFSKMILTKLSVKETEKSYELEVVAPGFEKTDLKINIDQDLLTISAEKKDNTSAALSANSDSATKNIRREYQYSSFKRSFTLDEKIDATNIAASYINGVLRLNLPKKVAVKAPATEIVIS